MRAVGLITEYNPFHNGHLYHLRHSLEIADAEIAVAVMSGHFLQRGEPALVDKWTRAGMALAAGVDLVVELPLPWACSSAPDFARGGIQVLTDLGVDAVCFGSESGDLGALQQCAVILADQQRTVKQQTTAALRRGVTFPQARAAALSDYCSITTLQETLSSPNNILGIAYLRALRETGSRLTPLTFRRIGAGYHDQEVKQGIASATGIRRRLRDGVDIADLVPDAVAEILATSRQGDLLLDEEIYYRLLCAQIERQADELTRYWWIEEGLEKRLIVAAATSGHLEELIRTIKARHLTRTRVQRALVALLLGIEVELARTLLAAPPAYLHLLAASERGEKFLAARRKQRSLPLVQNFSRILSLLKRRYHTDQEALRRARFQLRLQLRASSMYSLMQRGFRGHRQRDYFEPLLSGLRRSQGTRA